MLIKAEKNIMVGNTRTAKLIIGDSTSPVIKEAKRKSPPLSANAKSFFIAESKNLKKGRPMGVFNIIKQKTNCKLKPLITNL